MVDLHDVRTIRVFASAARGVANQRFSSLDRVVLPRYARSPCEDWRERQPRVSQWHGQKNSKLKIQFPT